MTDIQFAKEHMGDYFQYQGVMVRIVGFEFSGEGEYIIVAGYPNGWFLNSISPDTNILVDLSPEERLYYVTMDYLKEI